MPNAEPSYLTAARRDIGQRETLGPNDSKWIRGMWAKFSAGWLLGQPWCGGAVARRRQGAFEHRPGHERDAADVVVAVQDQFGARMGDHGGERPRILQLAPGARAAGMRGMMDHHHAEGRLLPLQRLL